MQMDAGSSKLHEASTASSKRMFPEEWQLGPKPRARATYTVDELQAGRELMVYHAECCDDALLVKLAPCRGFGARPAGVARVQVRFSTSSMWTALE